jgi:hypothetical protein
VPGSEVLVSPVHLAGPGDGRSITALLDHAEGWTKVTAFGTDPYYTSPCQRVRIAHAHQGRYGGWTATYSEDPLGAPDWSTTFDRRTPDEIALPFFTHLVHGLGNNHADYLPGGAHHPGRTTSDFLAAHDWQRQQCTWTVNDFPPHQLVSPDGQAAFITRTGYIDLYEDLRDPANAATRLSAGIDLDGCAPRPSWTAYFTWYTPDHLIAASVAATLDPAPVLRQASQIPHRHRGLVTTHPAGTDAAHLRTAAARARSPHAPIPGTYTPPSTPAAPALPAPPRRQR